LFGCWCRNAEVANVHLGDFGDLDEDLLGCRWVALDLAREVAGIAVVLVAVVVDLREDDCDGVHIRVDIQEGVDANIVDGNCNCC